MIGVDTNVLVFARRAELPLHDQALATIKNLAEGDRPFGIPLPCVSEFVRVVTHHRLFDPPTDPGSAVRFVRSILSSPVARLLLPDERFFKVFERLISEGQVSGNLVFDAQIAALCVQHGVTELITNDRDFMRFREFTIRTL